MRRDPGRTAVEADVRRELVAHLNLAADEERAAGRDPDAARAAALARFGDVEAAVAACSYEKRKEWILMQRATLALSLLLVLALGAIVLQTFTMRAARAELRAAMEAREAAVERALGLAQEAAADEPPEPVDPSDLIVRVGDRVTLVDMPGSLSSLTTEVDRAGTILLPEVGWFRLAGMSRPQAEQALSAAYEPFYEEPVDIKLEFQSAFR